MSNSAKLLTSEQKWLQGQPGEIKMVDYVSEFEFFSSLHLVLLKRSHDKYIGKD